MDQGCGSLVERAGGAKPQMLWRVGCFGKSGLWSRRKQRRSWCMAQPLRTPPTLATLVLLTALSVLSLNMFLPALTEIAAEYDAPLALVNLSIAGFLAITAVMQIVLGPLSDRYGRRPVMLVSMVLFALASLGAALAQDVWTFMAFRILQASISAAMTLSRAIVRDMYDGPQAVSVLGYMSSAMAIAPMIGPMFGGLLTEALGWRANFWFYTFAGAALAWLSYVDVGETNKLQSASFRDQFRDYPDLFRSRRFWGYSICLASGTGGFYLFLSGAPLVSEALLGMRPSQLGLAMGTITMGFFVGSFVSGRWGRHVPIIRMVIAGRVVAIVGIAFSLTCVSFGRLDLWLIFAGPVCFGFGNGITLPAANVGVMNVRPSLAGSAAGLSGAFAVGSGAVFTTVAGLVISGPYAAVNWMAMLLAAGLLGLVAALWAAQVEEAVQTDDQSP